MSDTQEPKPQKINRLDPAWAVFAAAASQCLFNRDMAIGISNAPFGTAQVAADFADAMIRERDRRDREEQE